MSPLSQLIPKPGEGEVVSTLTSQMRARVNCNSMVGNASRNG